MKVMIATVKEWNIRFAFEFAKKYSNTYNIKIISSKSELSLPLIQNFQPDYIFFPHWSWIIPEDVFSSFKCVVFHMTDLPYGRGGSPLQNLIVRKIYETKIFRFL